MPACRYFTIIFCNILFVVTCREGAYMFIVVGLGNPGKKYECTRHNIGHMVIAELAARLGVKLSRHQQTQTMAASARLMPDASAGIADALSAADAHHGARGTTARTGTMSSEQVILATSLSYMNTSGGPVSALMKYYHVDPGHLIAIHDDLDLPFGSLRLKHSASEAGHNGLKSISQSLGTRAYIRMRVGIGRPPSKQDPAVYVLGRFSAHEREELPFIIDEAADAVIDVIRHGVEGATMRLHTAQKAAGK